MEVVNGYVCKTCTDVDYAKKGIDPAHPEDGPYGVKAAGRKGAPADQPGAAFGPAIRLSGALAGSPVEVQAGDPTRSPDARPYRPGAVANISA